jgi:multimeric flavodoxin WrbA
MTRWTANDKIKRTRQGQPYKKHETGGKKMKVVAFNGSPRKEGNTAILINEVFKELNKEGIETELINVGDNSIRGCIACYRCSANKNKRCSVETDGFNRCMEKMDEADGIILGSPVYVGDVSSQMKALIDRACLVSKANGNMLRMKPAAAVVAVRRNGAMHAFHTMNAFFTIGEMIVVGSNYWNMGIGRQTGDVAQDEEGLKTMQVLGQNMAVVLKKMAAK